MRVQPPGDGLAVLRVVPRTDRQRESSLTRMDFRTGVCAAVCARDGAPSMCGGASAPLATEQGQPSTAGEEPAPRIGDRSGPPPSASRPIRGSAALRLRRPGAGGVFFPCSAAFLRNVVDNRLTWQADGDLSLDSAGRIPAFNPAPRNRVSPSENIGQNVPCGGARAPVYCPPVATRESNPLPERTRPRSTPSRRAQGSCGFHRLGVTMGPVRAETPNSQSKFGRAPKRTPQCSPGTSGMPCRSNLIFIWSITCCTG